MHRLKLAAFALAALTLTILAAACGSGSSNNASAAPGSTTASSGSGGSLYGGGGSSSSSSGTLTVKTASSPLGTILVDQDGKTLYLFEADHGSTSTCNGGCAAAWPPATTSGSPKAGSGAKAGMLGTTMRSDGSEQVTYNGHPLYWYAGDTNAGDTNGQALDQFGAEWYVVSPAGAAVVK